MTTVETYMKLREQGMTYAEIAEKYGISRQAIHQYMKKYSVLNRNIKPATVVFSGLRQWMYENDVSVSDLEHITRKCLRKALRSGKVSEKNKSAILAATGLSYNQAFGQGEIP